MEIAKFFYKLYLINHAGSPTCFLGSAFPITPGGGLLTCRHVVDVNFDRDLFRIAVFDTEQGVYSTIPRIVVPPQADLDIAFLPDAFQRPKMEFFPILTPTKLTIGGEVYTFGYFSTDRKVDSVEQGYFSGRIVSFFSTQPATGSHSMMLPFAVLEGLSGSPILTYHNGPKLVGLAYGNRSSRILASEVIEFKDTEQEVKETVHRIVEFGVAYHCAIIAEFLARVGIDGFVISDNRVLVPSLE